jgi:hypothetical protein
VVLTNKLFGTRPVVIHAHGPLENKPAWPRIKEAVFSHLPYPAALAQDVTLLTCNNGHGAMGLLERSAAAHGITCMVRGHGIDPWINSRHKPRVIHDALGEIDTEYVVYADSRDVVLLGGLDIIRDRFRSKKGCELLFGGDRINWPALDRFKQFEESLPQALASQFRYLNGGTWVGRTAFCRKFFHHALAVPAVSEVAESEQGILKTLFPTYYPQVQIDYCCEIFQNIGFIFGDILEIEISVTPTSAAFTGSER